MGHVAFSSLDLAGLEAAALPWSSEAPVEQHNQQHAYLARHWQGDHRHQRTRSAGRRRRCMRRGDTGRARLQALAAHMQRDRPRSLLSDLQHGRRSPEAAAAASRTPPVHDQQRFTPKPQHFKIPHGVFMREATAVGVDSYDNVYVFNRGNVPVLVFDSAGDLINQWGNPTPYDGTEELDDPTFELFGPGFTHSRWRGSEFMRPHAIFVDHEDNLWLVDDLANLITKCDPSGNRLMILAPEGRVLRSQPEFDAVLGKVVACPPSQSGRMFNRPTDVTVDPLNGDIFIADGYGNSVVHKLKADGSHLRSWGAPGTDAGQFNCPHNLTILEPEKPGGLRRLAVCDRENMRVQLFTLHGELIGSWHMHRPVAICTGKGADATSVYIAELGSDVAFQRGAGPKNLSSFVKDIGHRIVVYDGRENAEFSTITLTPPVLGELGEPGSTPGENPHQFNYLHSVATDSVGAVYAAEVSWINVGQHQDRPREMVSLRKWVRAE